MRGRQHGGFFKVFEEKKKPQMAAMFAALRAIPEIEKAKMLKAFGNEAVAEQIDFTDKFGRLFPERAGQEELFSADKLKDLAEKMFRNDSANDSGVPVGFAFLGQFIDHDITLDAITQLGRVAGDVSKIENFRTPRLDLDSVYLNGPEASPYLYERQKFGHGPELLIGTEDNPLDVQRLPDGTAIIGDPRNDENIFISQLQSLFIRLHNYVAKLVADCRIHKTEESTFEQARNICRWLYQWIIVNEFLPAVVHEDVLKPYIDGFNNGTLPIAGEINWLSKPFISVEFSAAAFRFGHSLIRQNYRLNKIVAGDLFDFSAFSPIEKYKNIDWRYLLDFGDGKHQSAKAIDTVLPEALKTLPFIAEDDVRNLAARNMLRGQHTFELLTGEEAAQKFDVTPIEKHRLIQECGLDATPLWFYVLAEAESSGGKLGPVGGQIVAGTLLRLLLADETSYIRAKEAKDFNPYHLLDIDPDNVHSVFAEMARTVSASSEK